MDGTVAREIFWDGGYGGGLRGWLWMWFGRVAREVIWEGDSGGGLGKWLGMWIGQWLGR